MHGVAFGFPLDALCAVDVCWAASDARISIEEVDVGLLAADKGMLVRVRILVGNASLIHGFVVSSRTFGPDEVWRLHLRLASRVINASLPGGLREYRLNKHLAGFLKPIFNKILFSVVILVCYTVVHMTDRLSTNGLDVLVGIVHDEEY